MTEKTETRYAVLRVRASEMLSLGRDSQEVTHNTAVFNLQAARITRRFGVPDATARVLAEHAYGARQAL